MLAKVKRETPDERAARNAENLRFLSLFYCHCEVPLFTLSDNLKKEKKKLELLPKPDHQRKRLPNNQRPSKQEELELREDKRF